MMLLEKINRYVNEKKLTLNAATKKKINKALYKVSTGLGNNNTYYNEIPWDKIVDTLKQFNIVPVQEDYTEWAGMFIGRDSQADIEIAPS